ncbi:alkaline shock response membrane anchor protein AmaP [Selenihalanaerobacter shriftii]|uniref:Asp23 family, cell envelope-related function n=1 Tax=Selenihalanaerobacter shriftii TaxID=142842 RepID=A0A1T4P2L7_9FIRM|nr:alkaline shock response membrane anchor protein AmaP [Selenihalanaerobacter shriftii]SJZ85652.1 Asp23 family, cell envelope-related function [Selenihalanaerobacter shriftii]
MKIVDRIIILVFTIILIFVSLGMMLSAFELIPQSYITNFVMQYYGRVEVGIIGLIFFIISIRILHPLFSKNKKPNAIVQETSLGQVQLSLVAIDALVKKVVIQTRGVKELKSDLEVSEDGLRVVLEVIVTPDINIPELTEELQEQISEYLDQTTGIMVSQIEILVDNIAQDSNLRVE